VSVVNDLKGQHSSGPYRLALSIAILCILLGISILAGWWLYSPGLETLRRDPSRIPPNGGLICLLLGAALASKIRRPLSKLPQAAGDLAAVAAMVFGAVTLLEYVFGWKTGVDLWIFKDTLVTLKISFPGRLSFPAALAVFCLGMGIALLDLQIKGTWVAQLFALIAALVALLALVGHVCNVPEFYGQLSGKRAACLRRQCSGCCCSELACFAPGLSAG
jgi:hypothetical protein